MIPTLLRSCFLTLAAALLLGCQSTPGAASPVEPGLAAKGDGDGRVTPAAVALPDEDGYDLWLRYRLVADPTLLAEYRAAGRAVVTLGGHGRVDPSCVLAEMMYSHPAYTTESVAAQALLPTLDDDRVVFAGAYHGWGFHEDGAAAGLRAAQRLGARWPTGATEKALTC